MSPFPTSVDCSAFQEQLAPAALRVVASSSEPPKCRSRLDPLLNGGSAWVAAPEKSADQTRIVALLAQEAHLRVDDVAKLYEHERAELAACAHVSKFVHIFATRNVQEVLRQRGIEKPALFAAGRVLGRSAS